MEITLSQRDMDTIIHKVIVGVVAKLRDEQKKSTPAEFVTTAEAAKILGLKNPSSMRRIADRYPHIKLGDGSKQGRLLFDRKGLVG